MGLRHDNVGTSGILKSSRTLGALLARLSSREDKIGGSGKVISRTVVSGSLLWSCKDKIGEVVEAFILLLICEKGE